MSGGRTPERAAQIAAPPTRDRSARTSTPAGGSNETVTHRSPSSAHSRPTSQPAQTAWAPFGDVVRTRSAAAWHGGDGARDAGRTRLQFSTPVHGQRVRASCGFSLGARVDDSRRDSYESFRGTGSPAGVGG